MSNVISGPRCNRRVTCDASPSNARSESAIAINPLDPYNIVASSKRFTNPATYAFSLAAYATFDGGQSWIEAPPLALQPGWAGTSDPAVAWDNFGNAYLVALPFGPGSSIPTLGIAVYRSADGGRTWEPPTLIHSSSGDDKQWAAGDINPASPFYGNVYAAWDDGGGVGDSKLAFARTTDHSATWKGFGPQPAGTALPGITDSGGPELSVAADGTIYIVWVTASNQIKFIKSTNGGESFSAPVVAASGITTLSAFPTTEGWSTFLGASFRILTLPTGCIGTGNNVIFAWADAREIVSGQRRSRIYYRHSTDGGNTWQGPDSGQPLLTGVLAPPSSKHDFHPQLISTPTGEIGCAFYEYGPTGGGEFPSNLIHVILAVSSDNGATFADRVFVTDQAWDPTVDAPTVHGTTTVTFIGDYFGLDASRLGFFPFWTDTRTGVQEMFISRLSVKPADIFIRDSSSDTGSVPSPGNHWEAPDLIVRRQPDGDTTFVNEDLLRDGVTDHYIYARVTNNGPNTARNVRLAATIGNYPSLQALPGTEFRYPQDWYKKDWNTTALQNNHLYLGENAPTTVTNGATKVIGPIVWTAAQIPDPATWHPCILAEVLADNNDSAGGPNGCDVQVAPGTCNYGSYFWGNNNVCQRNLSYATVLAGTTAFIELPFLVGSVWSKARFLEVIVDKGRELVSTPMTLRVEPVCLTDEKPKPLCHPGEIIFTEKCQVIVRVDNCEVGELVTSPGTIWKPHCPAPATSPKPETCHGGEKVGQVWKLTQGRASVGFPIEVGEIRRATLSFTTPTTLKPGTRTLLRVFQRNDKHVITGSVILELQVS
ncbi:MAG: exo-alpha-sialidase [Nostocaceae cyanobacterium]|nr:exo-alpha-sialidase [Nostocaceae cyanobacterium]